MTALPFRLSCLAFAALLLPLAQAAFNPAIVSAEARWIVYADLDALRGSAPGRELVDALQKAQREATDGTIGLDIPKVLTTVGSLTAYGINLSKDPEAIDGALIAQGTADLRKIAESVLLQGTLAEPKVFSEVTDLPFPAYAINDPKAPESTRMQLIVAFPPEPIVLLSKSRAQLLKARDVFRGTAPSLAKGGAAELAKPKVNTADAYLFAASVVPTEPILPKNAPQTRMLQLARSGAIAVGESGPDLFAEVELNASSDQNAGKLLKILQGLTAMLSLAESNDRELAQFLNAASVQRQEDTVTLNLAYPSARLLQMVQTLRARAEAPPARREPVITHGTVVAEWRADEGGAPEGAAPDALSWRTIENVSLVNGSILSLGRFATGGRNARFNRVEIIPAEGTGAPLVFRTEYMRNFRGTMSQFQFPGADGIYTLRVAYQSEPDSDAKFALSVRNPNDPEPSPHGRKGR